MSTPTPRLRAAPLFLRLLEAMILKRDLYERVAADPEAWRAAAAVVCVSSLAYGALMGSPMLLALAHEIGNWILPLVLVFDLVRWCIAAGAAHVVSLVLARDRADFRRLLRCVGFAQAPKVVAVLALVTDESIAAWLPRVIGAWLIVSTVAAVRYALGVGIGKAAAIGILGFCVESLFLPLVGMVVLFLTS
jgi:hypothetical protein